MAHPLADAARLTKPQLRKAAAARRAEAHAANPAAGAALAAHASALNAPPPPLSPERPVSAFIAIRTEIDPLPLARALAGPDHPIALPRIDDDGLMHFALWDGGPLRPAKFGLSEPDGPIVVPALVLVPLLAFNADGHRLGYGAGHYDRWLAAHPDVPAYGVAFAAQQRNDLIVEPHDVPLAGVVTEHGIVGGRG